MSLRLPTKDPAEIKALVFLFDADIEPGTTILAANIGVTVVAGADPAVAGMLDGAALIDTNRVAVVQRVRLGVNACDYEIRCLVTDSAGLKHLVVATLPVRTLH